MQARERLSRIVDTAPERLKAIPASRAAVASAPGKWSPKQELGHLIDSACNNHQRITRAQLDHNPSLPGYDGDRWVELHRYQNADWLELIDQWRAANLQLLRAANSLTASSETRTLSVGGGEWITLGFLIQDYLQHLLHHLQHIGVNLGDVEAGA